MDGDGRKRRGREGERAAAAEDEQKRIPPPSVCCISVKFESLEDHTPRTGNTGTLIGSSLLYTMAYIHRWPEQNH